MPYISIVIPVYNVESYLRQAIESIQMQSFKNIQIILINDGSTDFSMEICLDLKNSDDRIVVVDIKNAGAAAARNVGLDVAVGEYILFLDGDDYWIGEESLQNIVEKLEHNSYDVLLYRSFELVSVAGELKDNKPRYCDFLKGGLSKEFIIKGLVDNGMFPGAVWITALRRSFLTKNDIRFTEGIRAEDIDWNLSVFNCVHNIGFTDDCIHVYRKYRPGSVTSTPNLKHLSDLIWIIKKWRRLALDEGLFCGGGDSILKLLSYHYLISVLMYDKLSEGDKLKMKFDLLSLSGLLLYGGRKGRILHVLFKILGLSFFSFAVSVGYKIRQAGWI